MTTPTTPTMTRRPADQRGHAFHGWLRSAHTFSFAGYYDPAHMGFGPLRVINDDRIAPDSGFPPHGHRDMEIISYVVEGALGHRDTLGNGSVIRPGEVQRMSAGRGIQHSEMNASDGETRFLQIWVLPESRGGAPSYEQREFPVDPDAPVRLVVHPEGRGDALRVAQDVAIYRVRLDAAGEAHVPVAPGRSVWVQGVRGEARIRSGDTEESLAEGDGIAISRPGDAGVSFHVDEAVEALVFDLPEVQS